ncbi:hypothetical protein AGMMS50230_10670 [Spirochaetia bacterium]|nr:hypothetical protein AGMMS50230_10670 [Spirochaetia bacterium]
MKIAGLPVPEKGKNLSPAGNAGTGQTRNATGPVPDTAPAAKNAEIPKSAGEPAANLANLITSLKLPEDKLSRSIIAFARFFSLPLEPKALYTLRQAALGPGRKWGEAAALAAAAAADKGIQLEENALAEYAAAIDPRPSNERETAKQANKDFSGNRCSPEENQSKGDGETGGNSGGGTDSFGGEGNPDSPGGQGGQSGQGGGSDHGGRPGKRAVSLQHTAKAILGEKPLLDLINRIPGKNSRWVVIPLSFTQEALVFTVSLRILLPGNLAFSGFERISADIKVSPCTGTSGPAAPNEQEGERRWLITLEWSRQALAGAELSLFSGTKARSFTRAEKERLGAELAKTLGLPPDRVFIRDEAQLFNDSRKDHLRSIDETV